MIPRHVVDKDPENLYSLSQGGDESGSSVPNPPAFLIPSLPPAPARIPALARMPAPERRRSPATQTQTISTQVEHEQIEAVSASSVQSHLLTWSVRRSWEWDFET